MIGYIADLTMVALIIVGIAALMGVITNGIGEKFFGRKKKTEFVDEAAKYIVGWKAIGGNKK